MLLTIATPSIAFSQTDTNKSKQVCMPKETAAKIAQDLIAGDECREEKQIIEESLLVCEKQLSLKDSIIHYKDKQLSAQDTIIAAQENKYGIMTTQYGVLEKKYRKERRKGFFKTLGNITLLVGLAAALIIK